MTQVISIRIPILDLVGCYDLLAIGNEDSIQNQSMGLVVKTIVEGVIANARKKGTIPTYETPSAAAIKLKQYLPKIKWAKGLVEEVEILLGSQDEPSPDPEVRLKELVDPIFTRVEQEVDNEAMEGMFQEVKEREEEEEITKPISGKPPWKGAKMVSVETILELRPSDGFLEKASEDEDFMLMHAVQIAYFQFKPEDWADDTCVNLVRELYAKFKDWEESK
jgi:hypothetical protein